MDLCFISGSALAGYAYLLLNLALHVPISYLWWFWSIGFDGTHIFATATRTYFDRDARRNRGRLLFGSLAFFFALGPALVLLGWKGPLALLVGVWAYYHVIRQHYGFSVLYKVKNRDFSRFDAFLDRWLLGWMLVFPPYHRFFIHRPGDLGMPASIALQHAAPWVEPLLWAIVAVTLGAYVVRQMVRWRKREPLNVPKLLLFAAVCPLHWVTFATMNWQAAVPTVTIVHNLQYHALIWFHNRNKYGREESGARYGRIPRAVAHSLAAYVVLGIVFSLLYRVPGFQLGRSFDLAFGFFCGFGLTHYYLDSRIWRVRSDPSLRQTLQLA